MGAPTITDVCLVAHDLEHAIAFYRDRLGMPLRSRMPGFADFHTDRVALALWEAEHIRATTGANTLSTPPAGHAVMIAMQLTSPAEVDVTYDRLAASGVQFYRPPADYPWNARCAYFTGACGEVWEIYAWYEGGEPGIVPTGDPLR